MKNYYRILELDSNASFKEIRDAFRRLSKKYHPDLHQQDKDFEDYFKEIQEAYSVLKDDLKREEYDRQLAFYKIRNNRLRQIEYSIFTRLKFRKRQKQHPDDEEQRPFTPEFRPLPANYYKTGLVLVFVLLAVTIVFLVDRQPNTNSYQTDVFDYENPPQKEEELTSANKKDLELPPVKKPEAEPSKVENKTEEQPKPSPVKIKETPAPDKPDISPPADEKTVPKIVATTVKPEPEKAVKPEKQPVTESADKSPDESKTDKIYTQPQKQPRFTGGSTAFIKYLSTNLHYPSQARENGISGRVLVTFVVERDGKISNVSVVQGIGGGCDEEAVRVMENAPQWLPGEDNGQKVRVQCTIPITFALQ